jgi:chloride channel 2
VGAAFGRMIGEAMYLWFPEGMLSGVSHSILPGYIFFYCAICTNITLITSKLFFLGSYAIVGAAAFSAGVTHTVSISVVVAEMTGQIQHIIPILVAVIVSNVISTLLQPSIYESDIIIKQLPYLPCIISSRSGNFFIRVIFSTFNSVFSFLEFDSYSQYFCRALYESRRQVHLAWYYV